MRYGHQPLSEIDAMEVRRRRRLTAKLAEIVKEENGSV